jgi:hypothetical protein
MPTLDDVRRIALSLPGAVEGGEHQIGFSVPSKGKKGGFAWVWLERLDPKKGRVPNPNVIAIRTADLDEKESLLAMHPEALFTEPHYNGYPAVLVRLADIDLDTLEELITDGWRAMAPKELLKELDSRNG